MNKAQLEEMQARLCKAQEMIGGYCATPVPVRLLQAMNNLAYVEGMLDAAILQEDNTNEN